MKKLVSESNQIPQELDDFSSSTTIYLNKNVKQETRKNSFDENQDFIVYVYDRYVFSREEYPMYLEDKELTSEQRTAKIAELEAYLANTDWYSVRYAETGIRIPKKIKEARRKARLEISLLRDLEENNQ